MDGVFVIGTDTGVGKSIVCAGLLKLVVGTKEIVYWKPIQTGTIVGDDTKAVKSLTDLADGYFLAPNYRFPEPLSPHMAASKWGKRIELDSLEATYRAAREQKKFVLVEGAGGILVPFNDQTLQIDFIKRLKLPLIIVSQDRVGAINQCLLTLNAARAEKIEVLGIILTRSRQTLGNAEAIKQFGKVEILAELDPTEDSRTVVAQVGANSRLRELFAVSALPK